MNAIREPVQATADFVGDVVARLLSVVFRLQEHVIQQARIFHGLSREVQSVGSAQGHARVLFRRLVVPLLHRQEFGQLRVQRAARTIGERP